MRVTGGLTLAQFEIIGNAEGYPKLSDYLHTRSPGSKFIAVGEKSHAVESVIAGTGDSGVRMSSRRAAAGTAIASCPATTPRISPATSGWRTRRWR